MSFQVYHLIVMLSKISFQIIAAFHMSSGSLCYSCSVLHLADCSQQGAVSGCEERNRSEKHEKVPFTQVAPRER